MRLARLRLEIFTFRRIGQAQKITQWRQTLQVRLRGFVDLVFKVALLTNVNSDRCTVCEKRFSRSDHLAKHLKVHLRDRLYSYLASLGYGPTSRRGRLPQNVLNNEAVRSFIRRENIVL